MDLTGYPNLVVIYLGMRLQAVRGIPTLLRFGRRIAEAVAQQPDGLLLHERLFYSPIHVGMRQYWRDFEALETWARTPPHAQWWREFVADPKGTGFWHETYFLGGGMEAIYDGMKTRMGFGRFAPLEPALGGMFTARHRARRESAVAPALPPPVPPPPEE